MQENKQVSGSSQRAQLPAPGREEGQEEGCSLLPGKPGFMVLLTLLLAGRQTNGFMPPCYVCTEIRPSRAGERCGRRRKHHKVNTAVVHPTRMHCSSTVERMLVPSASSML